MAGGCIEGSQHVQLLVPQVSHSIQSKERNSLYREWHSVVRMNQVGQALDDLGLERKELFDDDGLGENMRHDSDRQDADEQELLAAPGVTDRSRYPDPAEKLEVVFFRNLVILDQVVEDLVICRA